MHWLLHIFVGIEGHATKILFSGAKTWKSFSGWGTRWMGKALKSHIFDSSQSGISRMRASIDCPVKQNTLTQKSMLFRLYCRTEVVSENICIFTIWISLLSTCSAPKWLLIHHRDANMKSPCAVPDLLDSPLRKLCHYENFLFHSYICCRAKYASPYYIFILRWISMGLIPNGSLFLRGAC